MTVFVPRGSRGILPIGENPDALYLADSAHCALSARPPATPHGLAHVLAINCQFPTFSPIMGVKVC